MAIGFRAFLDFERPAPALVDAYREIPSANRGFASDSSYHAVFVSFINF